MIIAQITDLHIGLDVGSECRSSSERLIQTMDAIAQMRRQPDLLLITGDLVDSGEADHYDELRTSLSAISIPTYLTLGNHDNRDNFRKYFPEASFNNGFLQYTVEDHPVRIIVLDTLEEGRHGGAFCQDRADWLEEQLSAQPDRPTLIALHHPPVDSGLRWLTTDPNSDWVKRLEAIVTQYDNIVRIVAGHVHRSIFKTFAGTTVSVIDAVARQAYLDLDDIDADAPDGRPLIVNSKPAFALHEWDGVSLTTHIQHAPISDVVASYDANNADIVKKTRDLL